MRDLFIISRADTELHEYLTQHFAGRSDVEVIVDRRRGERRRRTESLPLDRRRAGRRRRSVDADLASLGFAVVTIE